MVDMLETLRSLELKEEDMARTILISIRPRWVEKIASGRKTVELRKSFPDCSGKV